jgi:hypothetical protein
MKEQYTKHEDSAEADVKGTQGIKRKVAESEDAKDSDRKVKKGKAGTKVKEKVDDKERRLLRRWFENVMDGLTDYA